MAFEFVPFIFKSMKFFAIASLAALVLSSTQATDCGKHRVADANSVCIEPHYIEGCEVYESPSSCSQCQEGYVQEEGLCSLMMGNEEQIDKIVGCLVKDSEGNCLNCANGYKEKEGRCEKGVVDCEEYGQQNQCLKCREGSSLVLGDCLTNLLLGCKISNNSSTCQECWSPFQLKGDRCHISNCQALNDYGCVTCECGYYLSQDRKCVQVQQGCIRYERGRCINCLSHYSLKAGNCEIDGCLEYEGTVCSKCKPEYDGQADGGCKFRDCLDWENDRCKVCSEGFKLEEGKCSKGENLVCN